MLLSETGLVSSIAIHNSHGGLSMAVWGEKGTLWLLHMLWIRRYIADVVIYIGSPASKFFVTEPPILAPRTADACGLIHRWLEDCRSHRFTCPNEDPRDLPTGVLELSGTCAAPMVHLTETNGKKDRYIALSHCCGPVAKRPLCTTHANFAAHLDNIPFERLPKTFQDTVILALGLNIRYVWIDSLCIVQDDLLDWHSEAKDMGNVYRNATLVVAASGAADSTEGLFVTERPLLRAWKVPYIISGVTQGFFQVALLDRDEKLPFWGPLETRAWTLQERYLARRLVCFMPGNFYWKCRRCEQGEIIASGSLDFYEDTSWLDLLRLYTRKSLTYPGDRIHALRGIITEIEPTRQDQFLFDYGVWGKSTSRASTLEAGRTHFRCRVNRFTIVELGSNRRKESLVHMAPKLRT